MQNPTEARRDTHTYIYTDRHTRTHINNVIKWRQGLTGLDIQLSLYIPGWSGTLNIDQAGLQLRDLPASAS